MKKKTAKRKRVLSKINSHKAAPHLPRQLCSPKLKKAQKLVAVLQGGSTLERMQRANLLANHLELKLYRVDLRPVISKFLGETEKNLERVFNQATPRETLLYLDEADVLFGKPPSPKDNHDRYAGDWVKYLNDRLRDFPGSILLATNSHSRASRISPKLKPVVARIH